jgi:hypothetical protein
VNDFSDFAVHPFALPPDFSRRKKFPTTFRSKLRRTGYALELQPNQTIIPHPFVFTLRLYSGCLGIA